MMAAEPEERSVTATGEFSNLAHFLSSDRPSDLIHTTITYEHRVYHPRRRPAEHVYHTKCPHQFRLCRRQTRTKIAESPVGQTPPDEGHETAVDELIIHLSDSVQEMYAEWSMSWEFSIPRSESHIDYYSQYDNTRGYEESGFISEHYVPPHSSPVECKTIIVGKVADIQNLLGEDVTTENFSLKDTLEFKVTWSRQESSLSQLDFARRELSDLKRVMARTHSMLLTTFRRPSIDTTRLVFRSKRRGTIKYLYVPTHVLTQFEYFQTCHSPEYSETQHADKAKRKRHAIEEPSEAIYGDDSDADWDSDSEDIEPKKDTTFKATIHVTGTSRRTYQAFIDYAICGALYFAPLRCEYQQYRDNFRSSAMSRSPKEKCTPWSEWAEENCCSHSIVPGFKTLTSPKSLYRLADMLIIPQLKAVCYEHIVEHLQTETIISELKSSVYVHHEELRVAAYQFMRKSWHCYESSEIAPFIASLSQAEAVLVFEHILSDLA